MLEIALPYIKPSGPELTDLTDIRQRRGIKRPTSIDNQTCMISMRTLMYPGFAPSAFVTARGTLQLCSSERWYAAQEP